MRGAPILLFALCLGAASGCVRQKATSARAALASLMGAGLPTTAGEMVREPTQSSCPGGGSKRTQLETLRAHGDTREVRTTISYTGCRVGNTTIDGMLFSRLTHTSDLVAGARIFGNVDGEVTFSGEVAGACEVALTVEAAGTLSGSVCGAEVEAADVRGYTSKPGWPGRQVPKHDGHAGS